MWKARDQDTNPFGQKEKAPFGYPARTNDFRNAVHLENRLGSSGSFGLCRTIVSKDAARGIDSYAEMLLLVHDEAQVKGALGS